MLISRVERPSLMGVAAASTVGIGVDLPEAGRQMIGSTLQRHEARVDQQYAIAAYAAQQQYVRQQRAAHPDGDLPPIRELLREESPASDVAAAGAPTIDQVRELVALRRSGALTDAEFTGLVVGAFA